MRRAAGAGLHGVLFFQDASKRRLVHSLTLKIINESVDVLIHLLVYTAAELGQRSCLLGQAAFGGMLHAQGVLVRAAELLCAVQWQVALLTDGALQCTATSSQHCECLSCAILSQA